MQASLILFLAGCCGLAAADDWTPHYTKLGSYDARVYETSMFYWKKTGKYVLLENIPCGYWGHAGQWEPEYKNHSYYRIRDFETGAVMTNISSSIGMGFGASFIDYDNQRAWVFGTSYDRCNNSHNSPTGPPGVYAWWSDDLLTWNRAKTDANWTQYNVDVARVYGQSPPGIPTHKYVMATEDGSAWLINDSPDGNLTKGWVLLDQQKYRGGVAACPSVRYLPSDGYYYTVSGGHVIYIQRSKDLQNWEKAPAPFVQPSPGDVRIPPFVGSIANYGENPSTWVSMANRDKWDHNSNDCDLCCESWGGASEVQESWVVYGASDQGSKEWQQGPEGFSALGHAKMPLDKLLQSYFE
eukprot:TRINITY_DN2709_c2_g1_i1.p1 TRINITY_DN2709_c2_g1~~TRINITY_DN2709_c2_g1_i1.p1  ORF type:complete len:375 (+),score=93.93 TRINITY_DN2709_c2_g1_i1:65-1126(+)